jgi:hypothetical protein
MSPPPPPLWTTLAELWRLDPGEARRCWRALYHAKWSASASLRQRLAHFEGQPAHQRLLGVDALVRRSLMPQHVLEAVEALAGEALLSPRDRVQISEKILAQVDSTGQWTYPPARGIIEPSAMR